MSWIDEKTPSEWCEIKLIYAAVYTLLEISSSISFNQRYTPEGKKLPTVNKLVSANYGILRGLSKPELRRHWRWMCRDDPDKAVFRYFAQFGNAADCVNSICKGLKFLSTKWDIEKLLATPESELLADPAYEACMKSGIRDIVGKDRRGKPFSIQRTSKHYPTGHKKATTSKHSSLEQYSIVLHESMMRLLPDSLEGASHTLDFTGYSRENMDSKISKFIVQHMRNIYPGIAQRTVFYNVPKLYKFVWKVMKPFIPKKTLDGLTVAHSLPELLEVVDVEELPGYLGGGSKHVFKWIPPRPEDDQDLNPQELRLERLTILRELEAATRQWVESDVGYERRREIINRLKEHHNRSDVHVRHRTIFDRNGIASRFERPGVSPGVSPGVDADADADEAPAVAHPQSAPTSIGDSTITSVETQPSSRVTAEEKPRVHVASFSVEKQNAIN